MREYESIITTCNLLKLTQAKYSDVGAVLLFRMGIFSDEREVEQRIGEVLVGHGGVGKHARAGMAFSNGAGSLLIGFQMQCIRIAQIRGRWIQLGDKLSGVRFHSGYPIQVPINPMAVVAHAFAIKDISPSQDISF